MTHIQIGKLSIDIGKLKEGVEVDKNNAFLKLYDKNNDNIFQKAELQELQKDLESEAGSDEKLQDEEALILIARKMNIKLEEARAKFSGVVQRGIQSFGHQKDAEIIAKNLWGMIDSNLTYASVSKKEFQENLDKLNKDNVLYVLKNYEKVSKGKESLIVGIWKEVSAKDSRKDAISKLFNVLYEMVDESKYDKKNLANQFNEIISQDAKDISLNKLESCFNALIAMIEGKDVEAVDDLNLATENARLRNASAQEAVNAQVDSQGKISRALDNRRARKGGLDEESVKQIIAEHDANLAKLEAYKGNYEAYCKEFEAIFGVKYSRFAVENFNKLDKAYKSASLVYQDELSFNRYFSKELKLPVVIYDFSEDALPKEQQAETAFKDFYKKCCEYFTTDTIDGKAYTDSLLFQVEGKSYDEKFKHLAACIKEHSKIKAQNTRVACGGRSFEELSSLRNGAFNAAYGVKHDTYLDAQDWIMAQQKDLAKVQIASTVALTAVSMVGGPVTASIASAVMVTNPIAFTEMATDADKMTKEDWKNFSANCLENIGWMALGFGAGKVGQSVSDAVKLKGLANLMSKSGKSLDDLLANKNIAPDIAKSIQRIQITSQALGEATSGALDLVTTALLQKEGLTEGDWIMTVCNAVAGTALQSKINNSIRNKTGDETSILKQAFPNLNMSDADARKIIDNMVQRNEARAQREQNVANRYRTAMQSETMNSSIIPINPTWIDELGGFIKNLFSTGIDKLFDSRAQKYINKLDTDMKNAFEETVADITARLCSGELPNKKMLDDVCMSFADKHGVDADDLKDTLITILEYDKKWEDVAELFELKSSAYNKSGTAETAKALIAELRVSKGMYSQEHETAISKMLSEVETRVLAGEVPSKNMLDDVAQKYSKEFGVDVEELVYSLLERTRNDDLWGKIGFYLGKDTPEINTSWRDNAIDEFKKAISGGENKNTIIEDKGLDNNISESTKMDTNAQSKQKFVVTDELYEKYSYIYDKAFYDSDTRTKIIEVMEDYEKALVEGKINPNNFDEMLIYKLLDDVEVSSNDIDRCTNLIKEKFHQKVIAQEARVKNIKEKYGIYDEEVINDADKVFDIIREKMDNGQKITQDEIESIIYNEISDKRLVDRVLKYVCSDDTNVQLKNYIEDSTHYKFYNDVSNSAYSQEAKDEAVKAFDKINEMVKSGSELTNSLINSYVSKMANFGAEDLLWKLIQDHPILSKAYNPLSI